MKRYFLLLLFFLPVVFLQAQDLEGLVQKVKAKLDKVQDYEADGRMTLDVSFIDAPPGKVKVYYKKPDRFKVKKEGGISVLPKGGISFNMGSLLAKGYDIVPAKDAVIDGKTMKVAKLLPTDEESDVVLTTLYIDEATALVRKASVTTKDNGTYDVEMTYGKYSDWGLPDKLVLVFNTKDFKLPKGISFEYEKGEAPKKTNTKSKKGRLEISYSKYTINKGVDDKVFAKG